MLVNMYEGDVFTTQNPSINIYFNTSLHSLFPTLPYQFNSVAGDLNLNYKLIFGDLNDVNTIQVSTNSLNSLIASITPLIYKPGLQIMQEVSSVAIWNPIASLVFTNVTIAYSPISDVKPKHIHKFLKVSIIRRA